MSSVTSTGANAQPSLIRVNNKTDKLNVSSLEEISQESSDQVWISSTVQKGFASLYDAINTKLKGKITTNWVSLTSDLGWLRSELYSSGSVLEERISNEGLIELHLENFQNEDGSIKLPNVLENYTNGLKVISKND